jgi:hypothetical protein
MTCVSPGLSLRMLTAASHALFKFSSLGKPTKK